MKVKRILRKSYGHILAERDAAQAQIGDMAVELTDMRRERDRLREAYATSRRVMGKRTAERDDARALGEGLYLLGEVWVHQRDAAIRRAEAAEALAEKIVERAGGALEIAANDLEALDADEHEGWMPSEGELAPWEQARRAIDGLYAMLTPAEAQEEGD